MNKLRGSVIVLLALICPIVMQVKSIMFDIKCGGHMELAAKANSVDLAKEEMKMVIKYLEERGLTTGNTSILWNKPQQDLKFFYENMKVSLQELQSVNENSSSLEKSNVLMKLRETLTEQEKNSETVFVPFGISLAPHNILYAAWLVLSCIALIGGVIWFIYGLENDCLRYPYRRR